MMELFTIIFFSVVFTSLIGENSAFTPITIAKYVAAIGELGCLVDPTTMTLRYNSPTAVEISLNPKSMVMSTEYRYLSLLTTITLKWKDENAVWKPSEYEGITSINLYKKRQQTMWTPTIFILKSRYSFGKLNLDNPSLEMFFDGKAVLQTRTRRINSYCEPDLTRWPYDVQICEVQLKIHEHPLFKIGLDASKQAPINLTAVKGMRSGWTLIDAGVKMREVKEGQEFFDDVVTYQFKLQRHSQLFTSLAVVPIAVSVILVLSSFWISPLDETRLFILVASFVIHVAYLKYIGGMLTGSKKGINIIIYLRNSLIICFLAIILLRVTRTIILRTGLPEWMNKCFNYATKNGLSTFMLLPEKDAETEIHVTSEDAKPKQVVAALFFDRICFMIFALIHLITLSYMFINR